MATITPTVERSNDGNLVKFTYTNMANGDVGVPIKWPDYADRSVQVKGTFGVGGNLRFEGSNDGGTTYDAATDPQGNDINLTAANIEAVSEVHELQRPQVTAGDGTTSLTVVVVARRTATQ